MDDAVMSLDEDGIMKMMGYSQAWCYKYWKKYGPHRGLVHVLVEVPILCLDMLQESVRSCQTCHQSVSCQAKYITQFSIPVNLIFYLL